jgi:hypothetical protein
MRTSQVNHKSHHPSSSLLGVRPKEERGEAGPLSSGPASLLLALAQLWPERGSQPVRSFVTKASGSPPLKVVSKALGVVGKSAEEALCVTYVMPLLSTAMPSPASYPAPQKGGIASLADCALRASRGDFTRADCPCAPRQKPDGKRVLAPHSTRKASS